MTALARLPVAQADNFLSVYVDTLTDELVVTVAYRGTNADHQLSVQWGQCQSAPDGSGNTLDAEVLDNQANDAAEQNFRATTRVSLADLPCRPVTLTLRTAPRFLYTLSIPAAAPAPQ